MNRIYSCSERLLVQVFNQAGIDSSDIASEYRLTESADSKNKPFKTYILTGEDLNRITLSLWEKSQSVAIGFVYTIGFNAGIRSEHSSTAENNVQPLKKRKIPEIFTAFIDFLRFTV